MSVSVKRLAAVLLPLLLIESVRAHADVVLPPGFTAQVYVSGRGFDPGPAQVGDGIPATATLAFDEAGMLYLARTGRRYSGSNIDGLWPIYRIPPGGGRLTQGSERQYLHGPPLLNPQVAAIRSGRELFVTTFDRDRHIGVLYRLVDGTIDLFAGGTPPPGMPPLLRQPEGVAVDAAGHLYVADRAEGRVIRLDPRGRLLDPRWLTVSRPRVMATDPDGNIWVGSDGSAEAPWQTGPGELWRVDAGGAARLVMRGPVPAAIAVGPGGRLFVADRHAGRIFTVGSEGQPAEFARFTDGDAPRGLGFAPVTPATRRAGIAGDLFVVTIRRGTWTLNEVLRISGPFDRLVGSQAGR